MAFRQAATVVTVLNGCNSTASMIILQAANVKGHLKRPAGSALFPCLLELFDRPPALHIFV